MAVFFDILKRQHEHKNQNWQWIFSRFLNSVKFRKIVVNILLFLFHQRKFKKITNKAIKNNKKHIYLGIYNSKLKANSFNRADSKTLLIIAYYM